MARNNINTWSYLELITSAKRANQKQSPELFFEKKVLNFWQNSPENTCVGVSF